MIGLLGDGYRRQSIFVGGSAFFMEILLLDVAEPHAVLQESLPEYNVSVVGCIDSIWTPW